MASFPLKRNLYILIHAGSGAPQALRVQVRKVSAVLTLMGFTFLLTLCGTLLFFRELEINRKLQDRLLEWQTHDQLAQIPVPPQRSVAAGPSAAPVPSPPPPTGHEHHSSLPASGDDGTVSAEVGTSNSPTFASLPPVVSQTQGTGSGSGSATVGARIGELTVECGGDDCSVHLAMVPTSTGIAQGQLLLVLETEVPRIGSGNPTTQVRKRYFLYPGGQAVDELDPDNLSALQMKAFRFSRALQTAAAFHIGKLLRPLAVNVYLFDKDRSLLHHERKAVETEDVGALQNGD